MKLMLFHELQQVSGVQQEQDWSENRTLWHSVQYGVTLVHCLQESVRLLGLILSCHCGFSFIYYTNMPYFQFIDSAEKVKQRNAICGLCVIYEVPVCMQLALCVWV